MYWNTHERKKQQGIFGLIPQAQLCTAASPKGYVQQHLLGKLRGAPWAENGHSSPLPPVLPVPPILSIAQLHTMPCETLLSRQDSLVQHPQLLSSARQSDILSWYSNHRPKYILGETTQNSKSMNTLVFMGKAPASRAWEGVAGYPHPDTSIPRYPYPEPHLLFSCVK